MGTTARSTYELSDAGANSTSLTRPSSTRPGGKVGEVAATVVESRSQREAEESLRRLKRLVEG